MLTLDPLTWKWDFQRLPEEVKLAWLGQRHYGHISRLTQDLYNFRPIQGSGPNLILTVPELVTQLESLPIPTPYTIPKPIARQPAADPLDLSKLTISLDI